MKPILLAALAAPLLLSGCGTYVGYDGDGYYGPPGYYDGVNGDVAIYGYDRGGYHSHYHHYDGSYHNSGVASNSFSHASHVASVSRSGGGGHSGGGGGSAAHASAGGGGGGGGGGHR